MVFLETLVLGWASGFMYRQRPNKIWPEPIPLRLPIQMAVRQVPVPWWFIDIDVEPRHAMALPWRHVF